MTNSQPAASPHARYSDLDYQFLRYLGVTAEGEAIGHSFYLPLLQAHPRIVDLGCGLGGFVKFLCDQGLDAYGVDADPQCVANAAALGVTIVQSDVIEHLRTVPPGSLDAIFSAHLVEHLPYEVVMELIDLSLCALRPGGRLVLATPNPRALVSHLELYTMHFGHVAMYHPNLLAFFMNYAGFVDVFWGENPMTTASSVAPLSPLQELDRTLQEVSETPSIRIPDAAAHHPATGVIPRPANPLRRLLWYAKLGLIKWLVQPYYDRLSEEVVAQSTLTMRATQELVAQAATTQRAVHTLLNAIQRPFESYIVGNKPLP